MVNNKNKTSRGSVYRTINNKNKIKQKRADFWEGGGKGGVTDPLERQRPSRYTRRLSQEHITKIYKGNRIFQNIVDIPAEDMTREWIDIETENDELRQFILGKLKQLNAQEAFEKMCSYERLRGDGFISIGVTERGAPDIREPIEPNSLISVDYLHPFSSNKMSNIILDYDVFSYKYGDIESYSLLGVKGSQDQRIVDPSRIMHLSTIRMEDEKWGFSIYEPLYDILNVFDTALWSVGQVLFDLTFKVMKSKDASHMTKSEIQEARMLMDYMFRTEALALIEPDEELSRDSVNIGGLDSMLDFVWEVLSGASRMPKSHILGQQAGTITGAQYDSLNYYARIAGQQENFLRGKLEYLIKLILASEQAREELGEGEQEWELKFRPLWRLDEKTDAEIRQLNAEIDEKYMQNGVISPDEVREKRFELQGFIQELDIDEDSLEDINNEIQEGIYNRSDK